jgi:hypothetical protein
MRLNFTADDAFGTMVHRISKFTGHSISNLIRSAVVYYVDVCLKRRYPEVAIHFNTYCDTLAGELGYVRKKGSKRSRKLS